MANIVYFDSTGNEIQNDNDAVCKKIQHPQTAKYLIKVNHSGSLFNPNDPMYEHQSISLAKRRGCETYKWLSVSEIAFDYYKMFLTTKNPNFLKEANRNIC